MPRSSLAACRMPVRRRCAGARRKSLALTGPSAATAAFWRVAILLQRLGPRHSARRHLSDSQRSAPACVPLCVRVSGGILTKPCQTEAESGRKNSRNQIPSPAPLTSLPLLLNILLKALVFPGCLLQIVLQSRFVMHSHAPTSHETCPDQKRRLIARKVIPFDVRDEYAGLYGERTEERLNTGPLPVSIARAKHREWSSEIEARIANIRSARKGEGRTLTTTSTRAGR